MTSYSFNINIKSILFLIIVYPFFKPYYFGELGIMPFVNQILLILSLTIIGLFYFFNMQYINLNKGMIFIVIYYTLILISSYLNNTLNFDYFSLIIFSFGFGLLVNYCIRNKKIFLSFLSAFYVLLYIYVVANLASMSLYPSGIPSITINSQFPNYVFGNTNSVIKVAIPGLCFSFLYDLLKYKKIRNLTWLLLILVWATLVKTWSVTSMLGLFVFTFIVLNKIGKKQLTFWYFNTLIISIALSIFLVVLKYESGILANILQFFGKSLSFSGRDVLWFNTIDSIKASPVWGYGVQNEEIIRWFIGNRHGSHNYYLDTLFRGGFAALTFLICSLLYFGRKIIKYETNLVTRTLIATSCAYFIMWIAEPFISTEYLMFSILFVLISRIDILLKFFYDT
ncbi:O-antigen ligase family protein [Cytobacillus firmus]|uniref:O-antigen ligase family protein n=1 Tax=Cytobacillus firmus TaxID=1399 RepID=UPI0034A3BC9B